MFEYGLGWLRDYPDHRDYNLFRSHPLLGKMKDRILDAPIPQSVDLRKYCTPIKNQGHLGSCTANATSGLIEYFEKNKHGSYVNPSRLFIYKAARRLLGLQGDSGATLRSSIEALRLFGVPPEDYWPYDIYRFDQKPDSFVYSLAQNYQALTYYRLDINGLNPGSLLISVKQHLSNGFPAVFGFVVFSSIRESAKSGDIPIPKRSDRKIGGHAVMAVGYDDIKQAILIRNSWGTQWGEEGYGWLPYFYVINGLAVDWWVLINEEWVDLNVFK